MVGSKQQRLDVIVRNDNTGETMKLNRILLDDLVKLTAILQKYGCHILHNNKR